MYLCYFDESKHEKGQPYFLHGSLVFEESKCKNIEKKLIKIQNDFFNSTEPTKDYEFHGVDIFQGQKNFKGRNLNERLKIFEDIVKIIIDNEIPIVLSLINVKKHKEKYINPMEPYHLGLMFLLENISKLIKEIEPNSLGLIIGDIERQHMVNAEINFSFFKQNKTFFQNHSIDNLIDAIYFIESHHSRFLQAIDVILYIIRRKSFIIRNTAKSKQDKMIEDLYELISNKGKVQCKKFP